MVVADIPTSATGHKKVVEIKTRRNCVYEPRGCDSITAGRRAAEAKDGRTRGAAEKRTEEEEAEARENDAGDVVVVAIKCKNWNVCRNRAYVKISQYPERHAIFSVIPRLGSFDSNTAKNIAFVRWRAAYRKVQQVCLYMNNL